MRNQLNGTLKSNLYGRAERIYIAERTNNITTKKDTQNSPVDLIESGYEQIGKGLNMLINRSQEREKILEAENKRLKQELQELKDLSINSNWVDALRQRLVK